MFSSGPHKQPPLKEQSDGRLMNKIQEEEDEEVV